MSKLLLTESALRVVGQSSKLTESVGLPRYIVESKDATGRPLTVKLPVTTLNQKNENGRTYSNTIMDAAMTRTRPQFESLELLSTADEHPDDPYPTPIRASHVVTKSWCENDGYMWNEWKILDTRTGQDLKALIESGAAFGVSIRGLGSLDSYGNIMDDYEYLGTDCVGQPSAKIRTSPITVSESTNPTTRIVESAQQHKESSEMKTAAEASKYLREQILLAKNEPKMAAIQRLLQVEQTISGLAAIVSPRELAPLFADMDAYKESLFGESAAVAPLTEGKTSPVDLAARVLELEEQLKTTSRQFRGKVLELAESSKRALSALKLTLAASQKNETLQRRRAEIAVKKVVEARVQNTNLERRVSIAENKRRQAVAETRNQVTAFTAARDLAVESLQKYQIATRIAAKAIREAKTVKTDDAPATVAVQESARRGDNRSVSEHASQSRVVRTEARADLVLPMAGKKGAKLGKNITEANRNGTTRVLGFI